MGFPFTVLYIGLALISVGETLPFLAPFRIMVILALIGGIATVPAILNNQEMLRLPQFPLMLGFISMLGFSRLAQGWVGGAPSAVMEFLPIAMTFFFLIFNVPDSQRIRTILIVIMTMTIFMVTSALIQYFTNPGDLVMLQRLTNQETWEVTILPRIRFRGFLADPNDFAQFVLTILPFFSLFYKKKSPFRNFILVYLPSLYMLCGIYFTRSRGALMGIATLILLLLREKIGLAAGAATSGIIAATLLIVGFAGGRALSVGGGMDRLDIWSDGLGMFKMSPIWGVGYGGFTEYSKLTAHNSYVLALAELGIVGLFLWMSLIVTSILQLQWVRKTAANIPELAEYARLAKLSQFSLYAFLVTAYFLSRTYTVTIYIVFGISMILYIRVRQWIAFQANSNLQTQPTPVTTLRTQGAVATQILEPPVQTAAYPYTPIKNWLKPSIFATIGIALSIYIAIRMRVF